MNLQKLVLITVLAAGLVTASCSQPTPTPTPPVTSTPVTTSTSPAPSPSPKPTPTPTPELTAKEVVLKMAAASQAVKTYTFDMSMNMTMVSKSLNMTISIPTTVQSQVDVPNKKIHFVLAASALGQDVKTDTYLINNTMYTMAGAQPWVKSQIPEDTWQAQNQIGQQAALLQSAVTFNPMASETVDGVACYVISASPDLAAALKWFAGQQSDGPGLDISKLDPSKIFKSCTIKGWVSKETGLPVKTDMTMAMELAIPATANAPASNLNLDVTASVKFNDYNKPVTINLPPAALQAADMPTTIPVKPGQTGGNTGK